MITIKKDSYIVEVAMRGAAENYVCTLYGLIDLLEDSVARDQDSVKENQFYVLELLRAMLPDYKQAEMMETADRE